MKMSRENMSEKTFEQALQELETVTQTLAKGDLPLQESIALFKKGSELSRYCQTLLTKADGEIKQVLQGEKGPAEENFILQQSEYRNENAN